MRWALKELYVVYAGSSGEGDDEGASGDEEAAGELHGGHGFAEEEPSGEDDDGDAELVDRGYAADRTHLEGAKVAEPGGSGAEAGEDEEDPAAAGDCVETVMGVEAEGEGPGEEEDDGGADGGGEVAVDVFYAYFGEERGGCSEDGGEQCPDDPGHSRASGVCAAGKKRRHERSSVHGGRPVTQLALERWAALANFRLYVLW
jgi:hypothetical protein